MFRYRIRYAKIGALKYISNLDVHKIWERLMRRARLPLAYSQGFHPQPKLTQACPLPLGISSTCEMIDIWLEEEFACDEILRRLTESSPPGICIQMVAFVDLREPSLPTQVQSACYRVELNDSLINHSALEAIEQFLASPSCLRDRRGKRYDLRPLVESLGILSTQSREKLTLQMTLSAREAATGRPDEVLLALGLDPLHARIERTSLVVATSMQ